MAFLPKKKRGYDKTTGNYGKTKDILNSSSKIASEGGKAVDAIGGMRERSASKKSSKKFIFDDGSRIKS